MEPPLLEYSVSFPFDHGVVRHLHAAGLAVAALQRARHAVAQLEVRVRHVRAQRQLEVPPAVHLLLEPTHHRHVISVSGGGGGGDAEIFTRDSVMLNKTNTYVNTETKTEAEP